MALGMGQMPMQSGAPGQMSATAAPRTSLGFPRLPAAPQAGGPTMHTMEQPQATPPMWAPGTVPNGAGAPAPTGVMPTNPAAAPAPQQNVPASVIGDPVPAPHSNLGQGVTAFGHGGGIAHMMQDRLAGVAQRNPGFFDRLQAMMGNPAAQFGAHSGRGFDWKSFISGLQPPTPAVGAASTPAPVPAPTPAPVAAPQTAPGAAPANGVIFNPLNLPGIGG